MLLLKYGCSQIVIGPDRGMLTNAKTMFKQRNKEFDPTIFVPGLPVYVDFTEGHLRPNCRFFQEPDIWAYWEVAALGPSLFRLSLTE